jgi:hypothetical protein
MLVLWIPAIATKQALTQEPAPPISPAQLVREVVYNELHDHQVHGYWRYLIERRTQNGTLVEQQVETAAGPVTRVVLGNGVRLSVEARQQEQARLDRLETSSQEQTRHLRQYRQDEARIGRITALLPDAFLFEYEGAGNGCYRLHFAPNPAYPPHSIEARIFHAMSGTLLVDARYKRLAGLEGHVDENVDFGFGILGRLEKGGWFKLTRIRVSPTDWKTARLEMHMNIRALLVTSFARETSEVRGEFAPVPAGISVAQGIALLDQTQLSGLAVASTRLASNR